MFQPIPSKQQITRDFADVPSYRRYYCTCEGYVIWISTHYKEGVRHSVLFHQFGGNPLMLTYTSSYKHAGRIVQRMMNPERQPSEVACMLNEIYKVASKFFVTHILECDEANIDTGHLMSHALGLETNDACQTLIETAIS